MTEIHVALPSGILIVSKGKTKKFLQNKDLNQVTLDVLPLPP